MEVFNINSIWLTVLILSFLVVVHEFGHFITARAFGVTVHEFSVGFGPLIGKFVRNGIQYSFRWVLLGGFVKIAGMDIALEGEKAEQEIPKEKTFLGLPLWKKIVVIGAGPVFNLLLAVVLFFFVAAYIGLPVFDEAPVIRQITLNSPASSAGIQLGDRILSINNNPIKSWFDISKVVQKYGNQPLDVEISRDNNVLSKQITPAYDAKNKRYFIGIRYVPILVKDTPTKAFQKTVALPGEVVKSVWMLIAGKIKSDLMGPIGVVDMVEQSLQLPLMVIFSYLLIFVVNISISLFIFNMLPLPLPLLDGGWIVIMLLERLLRREFSPEQKAAAQMIGLTAVVILGLLIAYGDLLRIFRRFFGG